MKRKQYGILPIYLGMYNPRTIEQAQIVAGVGLHTGAICRVEIRPREEEGIVFLRDGVAIPALAENVVDTRRCTTLGINDTRVSTVEHLLAALALAGVDNAEIAVDGPELPALDGSAVAWQQAIAAAGITVTASERQPLVITAPRWVRAGDSEFFLLPADSLVVYAAIAFPGTVAAQMLAGGDTGQAEVCEQLLRARTFALEHEVKALLDSGLARGGSLDNAVVLTADGYRNAHVWPHEPAWHKALDLVGDLALVGRRIHGQVLAVRSGHGSHVALARLLSEE